MVEYSDFAALIIKELFLVPTVGHPSVHAHYFRWNNNSYATLHNYF